MDERKLDIRYTDGPKQVLGAYEIRGDDPYAAIEADSKLERFIRKINDKAEESVFEYEARLYEPNDNRDLGMIIAYVDHREEGLVEIDTDIAPYFVKTK